jgi:hypothetical protein
MLRADVPGQGERKRTRQAPQLHDIWARRSAVEYVLDGGIIHRYHDVQVGPEGACEQPAPLQGEMRVPSRDQRYDRTAHLLLRPR